MSLTFRTLGITLNKEVCLKTYLFAFLSMVALSAEAAEFNDLTVNGEAAFDYDFHTSQDNPPALGGMKNNQYRFNLAQLTVKKNMEKMYFMSRLQYTPTTYTTTGSNTATESIGVLRQLEVYYKATEDLHVGFGRFLTTFGFESPMRSYNIAYNYSIARQTLYPIYAEGVRAKYIASKHLTFIGSNYNRLPDATYGDDNPSSKATELAALLSAGNVNAYLGYINSRDRNQNGRVNNQGMSFWTSYVLKDTYSFVATYDSRTSSRAHERTNFSQSFSGTINYKNQNQNYYGRFEHVTGAKNINAINGFADFKNAGTVNSFTLGHKYSLTENIFLYGEYRNDKATDKAYLTRGGSYVRNVTALTLGAILHF